MSSFLVEEETIMRIVSWIDRASLGNNILASMVNDVLNEYFIKDKDSNISEAQLNLLVNALWFMNKKAVDVRYSENNIISKLRYRTVSSSDIQVLKSMECLRYQASEGDVPETRCFKFLSELIDVLRNWIISNLPEYEEAKWR